MSEFLVESYASRDTADDVVEHIEDVARAADQVSNQGTEVRFLLVIFAPEDETCFHLYESPAADAVRDAAARARLPFERVTDVISITAPGATAPKPQPDGRHQQITSTRSLGPRKT